MNTQKLIDRAKVRLMTMPNTTFVSTVLFSLKTSISDEVPRAGTDGRRLLINENFFRSLTEPQQVGLLFHETFHKVFDHMLRGKDLQQERYNIAGDHVINLLGVAAGIELPPNGYCDPQYRDMSTLQVYDLLPEDICSNRGSGGMPGDIIYVDDALTPGEEKKREIELTNILMRASQLSVKKGDDPGSIPNEVLVMLDALLNPVLPWEVLLQNYMTAYAKDDYRWTKPNRRFFPHAYLPSAYSEAVGHIAIAVDTSSSVTDEEFTAFRSEIQGIKEMLNPERLTIIDFDTRIKQVRILNQDDDFEGMEFTGRGGTDISPVWEWTKEEQPMVMIIFSDMQFTYPDSPADTDVLWIAVNTTEDDMPYGTTISLTT